MTGQESISPDSLEHYRYILHRPSRNAHLEKAHSVLEKHIKNAVEAKDYIDATFNMHFLILSQIKMGALFESEQVAIRALQYLDKMPSSPEKNQNLFYLHSDLGRIYRLLQDSDNALNFYDLALSVAKNSTDSLMMINNKGNVLVDASRFGNAKIEFKKAYEMALQDDDPLVLARALDNLGYATAMSGEISGLDLIERSLQIRKRELDQEGIYSCYRHFAQYYEAMDNDDLAFEYAEKAYKVAVLINAPTFVENALMNLLKARKDTLSQTFIHLRDSLDKNKLHERNKYAALQYNVSKEKEETDRVRLLQEKEKRRRITFQLLGIMVLGVSAGFIVYDRMRHRQQIVQNILNTEAQISQKVHDEIANDVYHLMNKLHLSESNSDIILDDLEAIYNRTRNISRETAAVVIQEDFTMQLKDLIHNYQDPKITIITKDMVTVPWKKLSTTKKITIYRAIQELLINMKKHSNATVVALIFSQKNKKIIIDYSDNGVGSFIKNKNGLANTGNRIKAISGSFTFESIPNKGFRATIKV